MTQDEIIEMARQAGFKMENSAAIQAAEIFYKLVAAKALAHRTEPKVCCQQYDTCLEPCTPRGRHLAQRKWVGLTDEEFDELDKEDLSLRQFVQAIEAKLKDKNGYADSD
jgi:hypothetical protein